ncbi:hypothetical protein Tco_1582069 [Tanacetum coccineum]
MLLGRTTIVELGMIPTTMHVAVLYQSKEGLEGHNIRIPRHENMDFENNKDWGRNGGYRAQAKRRQENEEWPRA